jgi:hypothetical protein
MGLGAFLAWSIPMRMAEVLLGHRRGHRRSSLPLVPGPCPTRPADAIPRTGPLLILLMCMCAHPAIAETNYSKTIDVPPLRISFEQLQNVLDKADSLMKAANGSTPISREEMELRKGELRVNMSGYRLDIGGAKIPNTLDTFEYSAWTRDAAPISHLGLSFADYRRTLSVEGQSPDQVDAVFSALRDELLTLSTFGGYVFRSMLRFFGIPVLAVVLLLLLIAAWSEFPRRIFFAPISLTVALIAGLVLLPIDDFLAGFSVVHGDAAFGVRYGPQISLWGLAVAVIALLMSLRPLFFGTAAKTQEAPAPKSASGGTRRKQRPLGASD